MQAGTLNAGIGGCLIDKRFQCVDIRFALRINIARRVVAGLTSHNGG